MQAYHGDQAIKTKYMKRVEDHRVLDQITQRLGYSGGRGCAVGCTLDAYDHSRYPVELGIPLQLAYLEDRLFELLPVDQAKLWPERFLAAIRPGADLGGVWAAWVAWMLEDPIHGALRHAAGNLAAEAAIRRVAALYRDGGTQAEFSEAAEAAGAAGAAAWAAGAASEAAAWAARAARAAAEAAAEAARAAAWAAAGAATWTEAACAQLVRLLEAA